MFLCFLAIFILDRGHPWRNFSMGPPFKKVASLGYLTVLQMLDKGPLVLFAPRQTYTGS